MVSPSSIISMAPCIVGTSSGTLASVPDTSAAPPLSATVPDHPKIVLELRVNVCRKAPAADGLKDTNRVVSESGGNDRGKDAESENGEPSGRVYPLRVVAEEEKKHSEEQSQEQILELAGQMYTLWPE